jgi:hypothetical protein
MMLGGKSFDLRVLLPLGSFRSIFNMGDKVESTAIIFRCSSDLKRNTMRERREEDKGTRRIKERKILVNNEETK